MNPYVIIAAILLWIASIAGVGYWQNNAGHTAELAKWQKQSNDDLVKYNAMIVAKDEAYRLEEQQHAEDIAALDAKRQQETNDAKIKTDQLVGAARAGSLRLRDPGAQRCPSGRNPAAKTATGAGQHHDAPGANLSATAAEFLLGLTGEADDTVRQLNACQQVVQSDRSAR